MIRTKYLILGVEAEGEGPIDAAFRGPGSENVKRAYTSQSGNPRDYYTTTWTHAERHLPQHAARPLAVQERMLRQILGLSRVEPRWVGYWCPVCSMFHPSDPKSLKHCRKCKDYRCPAAGCRCRGGP